MNERFVYVLMVTDGTVIEYPPEVYEDEARARLEAERWAWLLAGGGWAEISSPFDGRWEVAGRDVRLVGTEPPEELADVWVCTYWSEDGFPDPEALLLNGRERAKEWVVLGPNLEHADEFVERPWLITATYRRRAHEEADAVAWLAKVVRD